MKFWKTSRGNIIYQVLNGRNNCYLIPTPSGHVLVDTGIRAMYSKLKRNISSILKESEKIGYLVLTHTHFDHCQNALKLKKEYNCQILVGAEEAEYVAQGYTPLPEGTNGFTRFLVGIGRGMDLKRFSYDPFRADIRIGDHIQWMDDDIKIDLISTPGHSKGSISLIIDDEIAIVGDVMIRMFGKSIYPPFADDPPVMIQSWKKLLDTNCQLFLAGHRSPISRMLLEQQYLKYNSSGIIGLKSL